MSKERTWLKALRMQTGFTQEEFGERLGYSAQAYARIEHGTTEPKYMFDFLDQVAGLTEQLPTHLYQIESDRRRAYRESR